MTYESQANPHYQVMMLILSNVRQSLNVVILGPFLRSKIVSYIFNLVVKVRQGGSHVTSAGLVTLRFFLSNSSDFRHISTRKISLQ